MQSDFTTLPSGLMPDTIWPKLHKMTEMLSSAIACEDLTSTLHILGVCTAHLDKHMALLAQQVRDTFLEFSSGCCSS
jgi:hypothetical protein